VRLFYPHRQSPSLWRGDAEALRAKERLRTMTPEGLGERSIVTGNLEQCFKTLNSVEAAGIEEVILYFNFGGYSHSDTMRMMERFAKEVMPHCNNASTPRLVS
jgi:hypothetical protein